MKRSKVSDLGQVKKLNCWFVASFLLTGTFEINLQHFLMQQGVWIGRYFSAESFAECRGVDFEVGLRDLPI